MTGKSTGNYSLSVVAARGVATIATYGEWIMKSARIGASLAGVGGFFFGAYIMATSATLSWADVLDALESVVVVLMSAVIIGSFCIAIGWLAGLVLGMVAAPFGSFTERLAEKQKGSRHAARN
jgi:hypothetical protein